MTSGAIELHRVTAQPELEAVVALCNGFRTWLCQRYPEHDWENDPFYSPARWANLMRRLPEIHAPPSGFILLALLSGHPAGCVMLQPDEAGICEMKRLFVHPDWRGYGIGQELCHRLIADARALGYRSLRLDTGIRHHEAQALYESLGFRRIAPYYDCPEELQELMLFMELDLQTE